MCISLVSNNSIVECVSTLYLVNVYDEVFNSLISASVEAAISEGNKMYAENDFSYRKL